MRSFPRSLYPTLAVALVGVSTLSAGEGEALGGPACLLKPATGRFALNLFALNQVSAGTAGMRDGSSPIADRSSLCASFRLRTRSLQSIRACQYWFAAAIGQENRFASSAAQPYNRRWRRVHGADRISDSCFHTTISRNT